MSLRSTARGQQWIGPAHRAVGEQRGSSRAAEEGATVVRVPLAWVSSCRMRVARSGCTSGPTSTYTDVHDACTAASTRAKTT